MALIWLWCIEVVLAAERIHFKEGDVVAFVGGGDVAAAQHAGYLEALLAAAYPNVHFRNFGWEGDTVFAQPRDFNFPPTAEHLRKNGATVVMVQFGRMEVFAENGVGEFERAYERLLDELKRVTERLVLVTPVPFERPAEPLPDVSQRNGDVGTICEIIRNVGKRRDLPVVDLFIVLAGNKERITDDGVQLTLKGHAAVARAFDRELRLKGGEVPVSESGAWENADWESLRQLVIEKNRLWFQYWRPQNWAFLGGDRIEQPSSRDHRDPKVRWFPVEIEQFKLLISSKEKEIAAAARAVQKK